MGVDPSTDPGRLGEAITMVMAWATPPGIIALIVGWLGYRRRMKDEQKDGGLQNSPLALATLYADRMAIEQAAAAGTRIAVAAESLSRAVEDLTRELRLNTERMRRLN